MQISIKLETPKSLFSKLDAKTYNQVLSKSVKDLANWSENKLAENTQEMVYGDKIGNSYTFTGKLLRGRKSRQISEFGMSLESNPQIAGASKNYAGFVNKGTKKMRKRPYFDKTVEQSKKQGQIILNNNLKKANG
jgi:HK97 gp10 family phage protein